MGQPTDLRRGHARTDRLGHRLRQRDGLGARPPRPLSEEDQELHILTDLQRSGLDRGESVSLPPDVAVHLVDVGRAFPKNVAVTGIAIVPRAPRPGEPASITATVLNASPLPIAKCPVRLHIEASGQKRNLERTVDLDGGASAVVEFPLGELPEGLWRGNVEAATGDELPFDDRRFLALSVAPPSRVLLVDGNPGRVPYEAATYFLQAALRLAPTGERYARSPFDPRTVTLAGGAVLPDLEKTEAVVLADVDDLGAADAQRLGQFVENGGGLLVFTGDRLVAGGGRGLEAAGLGVGKILGPASAADLPWRLDRWEAPTPSSSRSPTPSTATFAGRCLTRSRGLSPIRTHGCSRRSAGASRRSWSGRRGAERSSGSPRRATAPGAAGRGAACTFPWSTRCSRMPQA